MVEKFGFSALGLGNKPELPETPKVEPTSTYTYTHPSTSVAPPPSDFPNNNNTTTIGK